jgi:hypothetical protein
MTTPNQICQALSQTDFPTRLKNSDLEQVASDLYDLLVLSSMLSTAKRDTGTPTAQETVTYWGETLKKQDNPVAYQAYLYRHTQQPDVNAYGKMFWAITDLGAKLSRRTKRKIKFPRKSAKYEKWVEGLSTAKLTKLLRRRLRKRDKKLLNGIKKLLGMREAAEKAVQSTVRSADVSDLLKKLSGTQANVQGVYDIYEKQTPTLSDLHKVKLTMKAFWSGVPRSRKTLIKRALGANNIAFLDSVRITTKVDSQKIDTLKGKIIKAIKKLCLTPVITSITPFQVRQQEEVKIIILGDNFPKNSRVEFLRKDPRGNHVVDTKIKIASSIGYNVSGTALAFDIKVDKDAALGQRTVRVSSPQAPDLAATHPNAFKVLPARVVKKTPQPKKSDWKKNIAWLHKELKLNINFEGAPSSFSENRFPASMRSPAAITSRAKYFGFKTEVGPSIFSPKPKLDMLLDKSGIDYKYIDGSSILRLAFGGAFRIKPKPSIFLDLGANVQYRYTDFQNPLLFLFYSGHNILTSLVAAFGMGTAKTYTARFYIKYINQWSKIKEFEVAGQTREYPHNLSSNAAEVGLDYKLSRFKYQSRWSPEITANAALTSGTSETPGFIINIYQNSKKDIFGFKAAADINFAKLKYPWSFGFAAKHFMLHGWDGITKFESNVRADFSPWGEYKLSGGFHKGGVLDKLTIFNFPADDYEYAGHLALLISLPQFGGQKWLKAIKAGYRVDFFGKKHLHQGFFALNLIELLYYTSLQAK